MSEDQTHETPASGVWRVLGPILLSVVLLGGAGWLASVQAGLSDLRAAQTLSAESQANVRERLSKLEAQVDGMMKVADKIDGNVVAMRAMLEQEKDKR